MEKRQSDTCAWTTHKRGIGACCEKRLLPLDMCPENCNEYELAAELALIERVFGEKVVE
jgi:hypothetical protein